MNRLSNFCFVVIISWCAFCAMSELAIAQTEFAEACRSEVSESYGKPSEFLMAKSKLTDALCDFDFDLALINSKESLELAQAIGDIDSAVIEELRTMTIRSLKESRSWTGLEVSKFHLSDAATPEQRLRLFTTIIDFLMWSQNPHANFAPYFESAREAADMCRDPHLIIRLDALEAFYRMTWLGQSPTCSEMIALNERLKDAANRFPYLESQIVIHVIDSETGRATNDRKRRLSELEAACSLASRMGNRRYTTLCNYQLGNACLAAKDFDKARVHFEQSLESATALQVQPLVHWSCRNLAMVYRMLGDPAQAETYLELAKNSPAFEDQSFLVQNALLEDLLSVNLHLGNERQARKYQGQVLPLNGKRELRQKDDDVNELSDKAARAEMAAELEQARLKRKHESDQFASAALVGKLWNYSIVATVAGLLFFAILVWNRLKKVTVELDSEKDTVRQSQQELDAMALRLNRMQRMESLGLMAGSVAHDFNNILVGVLGNAEVIQMRKDLKDENFVKERIANIITSAEKATCLSRQMLAYSGKQTIARYPTNLNRLIRQYEPVLRSACSPRQTLKLDLCDSNIISKIDPTQVEQVVLNLVTNAVEASSGKGQITISSGHETIHNVDSSLHGERTTGGEFCFIEVRDEGKGILPHEIERIFEPFYSSSNGGRGLGLAVVYGVIKGHHGFIQCRSEIGRGTNFRVLLPTSTEAESPAKLPGDQLSVSGFEALANSASAQTVLVIDDEESVLDLCDQLLQLGGWNVITAGSGKSGIELAERFADEISCVLLDVVMPDMGANEVLNELENRQIHAPTVIMSGFSQTKLEFFLDRPNVVSIVQKPFHAMEIQQAVKEAARGPREKFPADAVNGSCSPIPQHAK